MTREEWQEWWQTFLEEEKLQGKISELDDWDRLNGNEAKTA